MQTQFYFGMCGPAYRRLRFIYLYIISRLRFTLTSLGLIRLLSDPGLLGLLLGPRDLDPNRYLENFGSCSDWLLSDPGWFRPIIEIHAKYM